MSKPRGVLKSLSIGVCFTSHYSRAYYIKPERVSVFDFEKYQRQRGFEEL